MPEFVRNHVSSRCYLGGFVDETGLLTVVTVRPQGISVRLDKPHNVAHRAEFWGEDSALRREVEQKLGEIERDAAPVLRALPSEWPLPDNGPKRAAMMQFLAIHLLRTPGWRQLLTRSGERLVAEQGDDYPGEMSREEMLATARSDRFAVDTLMAEIPVLAGMFGSMHWSLVRFRDRCLITSDQPMVAVPFQPGGTEEISPMPAAGLLHALEFRISIDPYHLLLLTWLDRDDLAPPILGTRAIAAKANVSVRAQVDREWFRHPAGDSPFGTILLGSSAKPAAIAPTVFPTYSLEQARWSRRRTEAERHVQDLIDGGVTDELRTIVVRRRGASAPPAEVRLG
jgi:Protein of unknown function (DUF4238)